MTTSQSRAVTAVTAFAVTVLLFLGGASCVQVVGIGDSFTEGWIPTTRQKAPYNEYVQKCLDYRLGGSNLVVNAGIGWASVVATDKARNLTKHVVEKVIPEAEASNTKYDWAVVWTGGVNDFFNSRFKGTVEELLEVTKELWGILAAQGWGVLVIPQPALLTMKRTSAPETRREQFVELEKAAIAKAADPKLRFLDVEQLGLEGWGMSQQERARLFDGEHLNKEGYNRVGQLLCDFFTAWDRNQSLDTIEYTPATSNYTLHPKTYPLNTKPSPVTPTTKTPTPKTPTAKNTTVVPETITPETPTDKTPTNGNKTVTPPPKTTPKTTPTGESSTPTSPSTGTGSGTEAKGSGTTGVISPQTTTPGTRGTSGLSNSGTDQSSVTPPSGATTTTTPSPPPAGKSGAAGRAPAVWVWAAVLAGVWGVWGVLQG